MLLFTKKALFEDVITEGSFDHRTVGSRGDPEGKEREEGERQSTDPGFRRGDFRLFKELVFGIPEGIRSSEGREGSGNLEGL